MLGDPPPQRAMGGGIGDVGPAAEDGDGEASPLERSTVRAGVDPEGEAADDDLTRAGELAESSRATSRP